MLIRAFEEISGAATTAVCGQNRALMRRRIAGRTLEEQTSTGCFPAASASPTTAARAETRCSSSSLELPSCLPLSESCKAGGE